MIDVVLKMDAAVRHMTRNGAKLVAVSANKAFMDAYVTYLREHGTVTETSLVVAQPPRDANQLVHDPQLDAKPGMVFRLTTEHSVDA